MMNTTPGPMKTPSELHGNAEISIEHKEYETKLDLLYDIAQQASSAPEVSELLKEIPFIIQKILRASASILFLVDEEKWQFRMRVVGDKKQKLLEEITYSLDNGIAGWVARNNKPLVIDDISQDERYQGNIDAISGITPSSIIAAPLGRGSKVIGVLELINKADNSHFLKEDVGLLTEFANTEALNLLVSMATTLLSNFKFCQSLQTQYKNTVETLVTFADAKDPYSYGHSRRVKEYSMVTAEILKLPPEEMKLIEFGALLHDIGKLGIDDRILRKPGSLTTEEWYIIRKHTIKGANIVRLIPSLQNTADLILYHHERHDGKGYPEGLKGDQIPVGAQIIAVADAFETMTTDRAYRSAMTIEQAQGELTKNSGTQFSPRVVEAFISALNKHKGLLENLEHLQKPAEVLKQKIASEETILNQPQSTAPQPAVESPPFQKAGDAGALPESMETKPVADEIKERPEDTAEIRPAIENNQIQETVESKTVPEQQENKPATIPEMKSPAKNTDLKPAIEEAKNKEPEKPEILPGLPENKAAAEQESMPPAENTDTHRNQTQETGADKAEPDDYENTPLVSEILKILTENNGKPHLTGKPQKHEDTETRLVPGNREKQPEKDEPVKDTTENPEIEPVIIDVSKQKKKSPLEESDLIKNKENQLDAAEMLKKLLGDVRTRKDILDKKPVPPAAEKPAPAAPKETAAPLKSREEPAPLKPQETPVQHKTQQVPPKPHEAPVQNKSQQAPPRSHEVPAQHKTQPVAPRPHEAPVQNKFQQAPPKPQETTAPHKTQEAPAPVKAREIPATPKPQDVAPHVKAHAEPEHHEPRETPTPVKAMEALIPGITAESGAKQPGIDESADQDNKKSAKEKSDRKKAEKEARLASKKAEQEAKKEKQEAKKAKKSKAGSRTVIDISSELFEGEVKLEITPFIDFKQTDRIKRYLKGISNVKVISQGWSEEEGYIFFLSITEPTVLGPIFQQMPGVEKVYGDGKRIIAEGKPDDNANAEASEDSVS